MNIKLQKLLNKIDMDIYRKFRNDDKKTVILTINPHSAVEAISNNSFFESLYKSDYLVADGIGIKILSSIYRLKLIKRTTGFDIFNLLLKLSDEKKYKLFLLGASNVTLEKMYRKINDYYSNILVDFYSPPFSDNFSVEENEEMIRRINLFSPDILAVGMTAPKQELWLQRNKDRLNFNIGCAIGAVFDYYAGSKKYPSLFIRKCGLEWLYRLICEPKRLWHRTFISLPKLIFYILQIEKRS